MKFNHISLYEQTMDELPILPIELLHVIASFDQGAYRALLSVPFFARSLNPGIRTDYMIAFGYSVNITKNSIQWVLNGELHREHGPAVEYSKGSKHWYRNGIRHRDNAPAIEWFNGDKNWYRNGRCHREDGPAIEDADGSKEWFRNGKYHREDGPAIEWADGTKYWYLNGKEVDPF